MQFHRRNAGRCITVRYRCISGISLSLSEIGFGCGGNAEPAGSGYT